MRHNSIVFHKYELKSQQKAARDDIINSAKKDFKLKELDDLIESCQAL